MEYRELTVKVSPSKSEMDETIKLTKELVSTMEHAAEIIGKLSNQKIDITLSSEEQSSDCYFDNEGALQGESDILKTVDDLYKKAGKLLVESMAETTNPFERAELAKALSSLTEYLAYHL